MRRTGLSRFLVLALVAMAVAFGGFGTAFWPTAARAAELPPRPPVAPPAPRDPPPAVVSVVQRATPNIAVAAGNLVSYTIVAKNYGRGAATETVITLPYDPAVVSVVDAVTSRPETWVSELGTGFVEIRTGELLAGSAGVTITLRMRVAAGLPVGTSVAPRLSFDWNDRAGGSSRGGNLLPLVVGERDINSSRFPLALEVSEDGFLFGASIFAPNEPVGLWYTTPGGRNIELDTVRADENGVIDLELLIGDDPPGDYSLVAYGLWSTFTAVGEYRLVAANGNK